MVAIKYIIRSDGESDEKLGCKYIIQIENSSKYMLLPKLVLPKLQQTKDALKQSAPSKQFDYVELFIIVPLDQFVSIHEFFFFLILTLLKGLILLERT